MYLFLKGVIFDRDKFIVIHSMQKLEICKVGSLKLKNLLYLLDMISKVYRPESV